MSGPDCELDWHFKSWTKEMGDELCKQLAEADTILLGRNTYRAMAQYWPSKAADPFCRGEDFAFANMMNSYTKIVFSNTLKHTEWNNSKMITGVFDSEMAVLKKIPGKTIVVYGSGKLVAALMQSRLVDEYMLWLHPVILGKGKPFFNKQQEGLHLKLYRSKTSASGVVLLHYKTIK